MHVVLIFVHLCSCSIYMTLYVLTFNPMQDSLYCCRIIAFQYCDLWPDVSSEQSMSLVAIIVHTPCFTPNRLHRMVESMGRTKRKFLQCNPPNLLRLWRIMITPTFLLFPIALDSVLSSVDTVSLCTKTSASLLSHPVSKAYSYPPTSSGNSRKYT